MCPAADQVEVVREMALRCLDRRAYGTAELKAVLLRKGAEESVIDDVLSRLARVGLLDDVAYAESLVEQRHGARHQSRQAVTLEMRRRGLSPEVVDEATASLDDASDVAGARLLVAQRLPRLAGLDRAVKWRRLCGLLARKGYSPGVVADVVHDALGEEDLSGTYPQSPASLGKV